INPSCINTLRVISVRQNDKIYIANCIFRMGVGNVDIDNASVGGIFVNYDIETNTLDKIAHKFFKYGGTSYLKHPDTGFIFDRAPLPYPEKISEIITKAALLFEMHDILGW